MGAICAVKKASYDGVDCVGEDDTATGTVKLWWSFAKSIFLYYYQCDRSGCSVNADAVLTNNSE